MVKYFAGVDTVSSDSFVYAYSNVTGEELTKVIDGAMASIGYAHKGQGVYEKGSRVKRLLLGALVKYFKCQIAIDTTDPQYVRVKLTKKTSGMSGGLIGMGQVKTEMKYLTEAFQSI